MLNIRNDMQNTIIQTYKNNNDIINYREYKNNSGYFFIYKNIFMISIYQDIL